MQEPPIPPSFWGTFRWSQPCVVAYKIFGSSKPASLCVLFTHSCWLQVIMNILSSNLQLNQLIKERSRSKDLCKRLDWNTTLFLGIFDPSPPLHFPFQSDTSTTYKIKQLPNRPPLSTKGENCLEDDFKGTYLTFSLSLSTGMSFTRNVWILGWSSRGRAPSANRTSQTTTGDGWLPVVPAASVASAVVQHRRVASRRKRKYRAWSNSRVCR